MSCALVRVEELSPNKVVQQCDVFSYFLVKVLVLVLGANISLTACSCCVRTTATSGDMFQ